MSILERRKLKSIGLNMSLKAPIAAVAVTGLWAAETHAAAISAGDLVVYQVGANGSNALTSAATAVFVDEYTTSGTFVQQIALPSTTALGNALTASGTATSEGELTVSPNGQFIALTGYDANAGTAAIAGTNSTVAPRVVGIIPVSTGTPNTTTTLGTDFTGNNPRGAVTDGTNVWVTGTAGNAATNGGIFATTIGSTTGGTQLIGGNDRVVNIFGSQLFVSSASGTAPAKFGVSSVGSGTPTTAGQTTTALADTSNLGSPYSFFFADLNANVAGVDTLYVADDGATTGSTVGGIQKYSLVNGTWVLNNIVGSNTNAFRGLTGTVSGNTVQLFATTGDGAAGTGTIFSLTDTSGYNVNDNASVNTLVSAPAGTNFRGIGIVPAAVSAGHSATIALTSSSPTGSEFIGTENPSGPNDVNPSGSPPSVSAGFLNNITNGLGGKGFVTIASIGGASALELIGISITVQDTANGTAHVLTASNDSATLQDIINDLNAAGAITNVDGGTSTAYIFGGAAAAAAGYADAEGVLANGEAANGGQLFSILIATADPQDMSVDFSNEVGNLDGISSLNLTDIGVVPEPTSMVGLLAIGGTALLGRRRRRGAAH